METTRTEGVQCAVADNEAALQQVYRLRYACYRRAGAIGPRENGQFSDPFDTAPNQFTFLCRAGGEAVATVRVSVVRPDLGWMEAPARRVYGDDPAFAQIGRGAFAEASRLCFGAQARRESFVRLVANLAALADIYEVGWVVACPRVEHCHAYERLFGFRRLAEPRRYFGVKFETQLLGIRAREFRSFVGGYRVIESARQDALQQFAFA